MSEPKPLPIAPLMRRLSAAFYEVALLFGIYFIPAYLYLSLSQSKGILQGVQLWLFQGFIFLIFGIYFVWSWSQGRRTLPQKTWGVRIVKIDGSPLPQTLAAARYVLAWLSLSCFLLGFFYAWFDKERAFLHDRLLGTRIILDDIGTIYGKPTASDTH